ncbi:MAG: hypothetical protein HYX60_04220 [Legionella longbeachae]|nr:hypothetical protein [Legionella longbeachae]
MFRGIFIFGFCALFTTNVLATVDLYAPVVAQAWSSIITISGGPAWSNPGKDQYLYPFPPPMSNYYIADSKSDFLGTGELYFGLQNFIGASNVIGQLGLGVAAASDASLSGVVNVNGVPNVYTYSYKVSHVRAEMKGKLIANGFALVQPYLSGSFGVGFNHAHDFLSTTINPVLYPKYWFDTNSVVAFSYTLGLGVQKMLSPNWQVGLGVEFADWGKNYLGGDSATNLNQGPGMPHLYTTELLFSLSYVF